MVKEIKFKKSGQPLYARISSGYAQPGSYTYRLWEANENVKIDEKDGNFINPSDDIYPLPIPNDINDGRVVQFFVVLTITPPINDYSIKLEILQGQQVIGEEVCSGKGEKFIPINLFVILKAQ